MAVEDLLAAFDGLRRRRRSEPAEVLLELGAIASEAIVLLNQRSAVRSISWHGAGNKTYSVLVNINDESRWSRALNDELFINDHASFGTAFQQFAASLNRNSGRLDVPDLTPQDIDRPVYTAVMAFAAMTDLFNPSRGLGGTFFEMVVGPTIALLTSRPETGDVTIAIPGEETTETVKVDLTFHPIGGRGRSLAVPTKISTRERISQAFVHARILETAFPGQYRHVLCIVNENNAFHEAVHKKTAESLGLRDTLVPRTIALYQRYVAELDGLYYVDPPQQYLTAAHPGLPPVKPFSSLLLGDLRLLLNSQENRES